MATMKPGKNRLITMTHPRDVKSMHLAPRGGAKTRRGEPCRAPAVRGKKRCRLHGGSAGSGAPIKNRNALKNGLFTAESIAIRQRIRAEIEDALSLLSKLVQTPD